MTVTANYQAVTNLLDVKNFADYMIINYYVGNTGLGAAQLVRRLQQSPGSRQVAFL